MPAVLADEADAYRFLEALRWNGAPELCPHCSALGRCYLLQPADGTSRRTRTGSRSQRRVWKCGACRRQFSVLTATIMQGTRLSIRTWVAVIAELTRAGERCTPTMIAGRYGVTTESARHVIDRVCAALDVDAAASGRARIGARRGDPPT